MFKKSEIRECHSNGPHVEKPGLTGYVKVTRAAPQQLEIAVSFEMAKLKCQAEALLKLLRFPPSLDLIVIASFPAASLTV
jgi:hypothetical protein